MQRTRICVAMFTAILLAGYGMAAARGTQPPSAALRQLTRRGGSDDGAAAAVCRLCRRKLRKPAEAQLPGVLLRRCVALLASFVR